MKEVDVNAGAQTGFIRRILTDTLLHHGSEIRAVFVVGRAVFCLKRGLERLDEMCLGAQQHAADEISGGNAGGALDDFEASSLLDKPVAILTVAVGCNVIAVDNILATVMGDPWQASHVWRTRNGFGHPAAGVRGRHAVLTAKHQQSRRRAGAAWR